MLNVSISNRSTKNKERGLSCEVNGHGIHVIPPTSDGRSVQQPIGIFSRLLCLFLYWLLFSRQSRVTKISREAEMLAKQHYRALACTRIAPRKPNDRFCFFNIISEGV